MILMNNSKENCPHCDAELQGAPIPQEQQKSFGATHYSRKIGIYDITKDRTVKWKCPDCEGEWDRE
jgi:hypothetical protein